MSDKLAIRYTNTQLEKILDEAMIYMCACPAQVSEQLLNLRELYEYQNSCITKGSQLADVHRRIADATRAAHIEMEQCLDDVLKMEGWDPQTLIMPEGLRELRQKSIEQDQ
jgi:hypothetical protein